MFCAGFLSFFWALCIAPSALQAFHSTGRDPLNYETVTRAILSIWLVFFWALCFSRKDISIWMMGYRWSILISIFYFCGIFTTFIFDSTPFQNEISWIRNWTACVLLLASITAWTAVFWASPPKKTFLGVFFGFLFGYAAADEMFEIHERWATGLMRIFSIRYAIADDLPTLSLGIFGLVFAAILFLFKSRSKKLSRTDSLLSKRDQIKMLLDKKDYDLPFKLFVWAVATFFCATLLDTFDGALVKAKYWVDRSVSFPFPIPSDLTLAFYDLAHFANSLEEGLEFAAAGFFWGMTMTLFYPGYFCSPVFAPYQISKKSYWPKIPILFLLGTSIVLFLTFPPSHFLALEN